MQEKKMSPDMIMRAASVYTAGPDNWDHVIPTEFSKYTMPPRGIDEVPLWLLDRKNNLRRIAPEVYNTPVLFNDRANFSVQDADGRYNSADNVIGIPDAAARAYVLNHEGTHAARMSPTGDPVLDKYLIDNTNQKDAGIPYENRKEEIKAVIAENLTNTKNMEEVISALNSMYKVKQDKKGKVLSSSTPSDIFAVDRRLEY
jgi:hypothetical protein